jgi:hypothetical protein
MAGIVLLAALAAAPLRAMLEARMATHMLVQLPLLAIAGALLVHPLVPRLQARLQHVDGNGIATALVAVFASSYWMLPRALDAALSQPWVEFAKFVTLPLLVGGPVRLAIGRLSAVSVGFFLANVLSMWAAAGWLYRAFPARLCNYYLIEDQILAGSLLVLLATALAALWLSSFFVGARRQLRAPIAL